MKKMLTAMNSTCSFFGDDGMSSADIDTTIDQIWTTCNVTGTALNYTEYCNAVAENPILVQFITKSAAAVRGEGNSGGGDEEVAAK